MDPVQMLQEVGWSALEARVYVSLTEAEGALTGYQTAKVARIARANVYPVIERLIRRGALLEEPGDTGPRYRAVPFTTVSHAQINTLQNKMAQIDASLPVKKMASTFFTGRGQDALWTHGSALIRASQNHIAVGASANTVPPFAPLLKEARDRKISEQFICFDQCPPPGCGVCPPRTHVPLLGSYAPRGWLVLIRDNEEALISVGSGASVELVLTNMEPIRETIRVLFNQSLLQK